MALHAGTVRHNMENDMSDNDKAKIKEGTK